jgi:rfaE bifunctional protein kinase chain/domain
MPHDPKAPSRPVTPPKDRLRAIVAAFAGVRVTVVGDLVVDEYVYGRTQRVSREAPVLIVRYGHEELVPGAAANAAANLASLGARVTAVGLVGRDSMGNALADLLRARGILARLVRPAGRTTARKTRVLAGDLHTTRQQVLRIDREGGAELSPAAAAELLAAFQRAVRGARAVLVSDYGDGAVQASIIEAARRAAKGGAIVCADSRHNVADYRGIPWVTPNEPEAAAALGIAIEDSSGARVAGARLLRMTRGEGVLLTRGAQGLALFARGAEPLFVPPFGGVDVADVTGAGDTVAAVFTLALAAGASARDAAILANVGGGLVVAKRGTATLEPAELERAIGDIDAALLDARSNPTRSSPRVRP